MSLINNKNIIRLVLVSSFLLINFFLLYGLSNVLEFLNSGADRKNILHLEKETINTYLPKIVWEKNRNEGREMEPSTLKILEKHYLLSWYIKNNAFAENKKNGIEDFYTKSSRANLFKTIDYNLKNNIHIESTTIEHHPRLEFYSEDGQQIALTDKNVIEFQQVYKEKKLIAEIQDTATYKIVLLLEDGFWRIRHFYKAPKVPFVKDTIPAMSDFKIVGKKIKFKTTDFVIKGINYYPKNAAWDMFGKSFQLDTIAKDFDIISHAKLNTIRIFIQYEDFGKADVKPEKLKKLQAFLDLAEHKKLKVIVTLFDFYSDYSLKDWSLTLRHAEKIVSTFTSHKAILAWDLKNEPNLDFKNRGKENVLNWLEQIATLIKENDPNHFITIGWSNSTEATHLKNKVDFISYHFYNAITEFEKEQAQLNKKTSKPIVVQEFGIPSYKGIWNWNGYNEEEQAEYHKQMQLLFKKNNISFMSWTLYDFPKVPDIVAGKWPWQKLRQKKFGFINEKGAKKAAFQYINH